jgi:hypothetical protein
MIDVYSICVTVSLDCNTVIIRGVKRGENGRTKNEEGVGALTVRGGRGVGFEVAVGQQGVGKGYCRREYMKCVRLIKKCPSICYYAVLTCKYPV